MFAAALVALNLHVAWIAFGVLAVILAAWLHVAVDGKVDAERRGAIEEGRALLKRLRLQGVSEETLRRFVRTTAGDDWEQFFESLFGFDAVTAAREPSERGLLACIRRRVVPLARGGRVLGRRPAGVSPSGAGPRACSRRSRSAGWSPRG